MAITKTKITGDIALPDGTIPSQSSVTFTMTGFDTDAVADATIAPRSVTSVLSDAGALDVDLWSNEDGERTTFYNVRLNIYNGNSPKIFDVGKIEVPTTGGPYDLNDLLPIAPPSGATVDEYIAQLAASVAAAEAAADTAVAAATPAAELIANVRVTRDEFSELASVTASDLDVGEYARVMSVGATYQRAADAATDARLDYSGSGGVKWYYIVSGTIRASALGYVTDGVTDNADVIKIVEAILREQGGGLALLDGGGTAVSSYPMIVPSFSKVEIEGELSYTGVGNAGVYLGQLNRTDIARFVGVEEAAYDAGSLADGDYQVTLGGRWNNTASDFSNPATWTPAVGDRVVLNVNDDTAASPSTPVPSATYLRRVLGVSGSVLTLDAPVSVAGDYVITPASRGLGYDRTTYGGVGNVEVVERAEIVGRVSATGGVPVFYGAVIEPFVDVDVRGRTGCFGNAARGGLMRVTGEITETACEVKLGSENPFIDLDLRHKDDGVSYTAALVSTGENSIGASFARCNVSAPEWNGDTALNIRSTGVSLKATKLITAATSTLAFVGSSTTNGSDFLASDVFISSSNGAMSGVLLDVDPGSSNVVIADMVLSGVPTASNSVVFDGDGEINRLEVIDDAGVVRLNGDIVVSGAGILTSGSVVHSGSRVTPSRVSGMINNNIVSTSYAATLTPSESLRMTLTGPLDLQSPTIGGFEDGDILQLTFTQDGTGGHALTFAAGNVFRGLAAPGSGSASDRFSMTIQKQGSAWIVISTNGSWA